MGEKIDTTLIQWIEVNKPHIVFFFERIWPWMVLLISNGSPLGLWRLETMELYITFLFLCLWAGFFFCCSIAPCLISLKDFGGDFGTWLEYLFWKAISVGRIRSKMCEQSDMGFYWWRNVWRRWMLESKLELSISRHGKASTWGQMERGKWSVLKCHYSIRAQVLTKLNTTI